VASPSLRSLDQWLAGHTLTVAAVAIIVILAVMFGAFLVGRQVYLFRDIGSDTVNVYYPELHHVAHHLRTEGLPRGAFSQGMGQSIRGTELFAAAHAVRFPGFNGHACSLCLAALDLWFNGATINASRRFVVDRMLTWEPV
jgi:hypothetical protein